MTGEVLKKRNHQIRAKLQTQKISPEIMYDFTSDHQPRRSTKLLASLNKKKWVKGTELKVESDPRIIHLIPRSDCKQWALRGSLKLMYGTMITSSHTRALTYNLPASTTPGPKFHLFQNVEDWRPRFSCAQIQQLEQRPFSCCRILQAEIILVASVWFP